ncbi:unnamed protein product [Somion occarium]
MVTPPSTLLPLPTSNVPQVKETIAQYPFDDASADIILRTSDRIVFNVHKVILSYASGFFRDMFSLNQSALTCSQGSGSSQESPPVVDVAENGEILYEVLHWCYPLPHTEPKAPEKINMILDAAVKYDMAGVISSMFRPLRDLRETHTLQVFAIACRFGFEDLAGDAASVLRTRWEKECSGDKWDTPWGSTTAGGNYASEMAHIRAASYLRLVRFVRTGERTAFCEPADQEASPSGPYSIKYILHPDADLTIRSQLNDGFDFKVHRQIISFSSSTLKEKILSLQDAPDSDDSQRPPVLELPESSAIISTLLALCYPSDDQDAPYFDPSDIPALVVATQKYQLKRAIPFFKRHLQKHTAADPFKAYCIAVRCNWRDEARHAAIHIARLQVEERYHSMMESFDARHYYPLLKFCHEYRREVTNVASKSNPPTVSNGPGVPEARAWSSLDWMWKLVGSDIRDATWALSFYASYRSSLNYYNRDREDMLSRLNVLHSDISERLNKLVLEIPGDDELGQWRSSMKSPGTGKGKGKGRKGNGKGKMIAANPPP